MILASKAQCAALGWTNKLIEVSTKSSQERWCGETCANSLLTGLRARRRGREKDQYPGKLHDRGAMVSSVDVRQKTHSSQANAMSYKPTSKARESGRHFVLMLRAYAGATGSRYRPLKTEARMAVIGKSLAVRICAAKMLTKNTRPQIPSQRIFAESRQMFRRGANLRQKLRLGDGTPKLPIANQEISLRPPSGNIRSEVGGSGFGSIDSHRRV
jgi:hypothetical protein